MILGMGVVPLIPADIPWLIARGARKDTIDHLFKTGEFVFDEEKAKTYGLHKN